MYKLKAQAMAQFTKENILFTELKRRFKKWLLVGFSMDW